LINTLTLPYLVVDKKISLSTRIRTVESVRDARNRRKKLKEHPDPTVTGMGLGFGGFFHSNLSLPSFDRFIINKK